MICCLLSSYININAQLGLSIFTEKVGIKIPSNRAYDSWMVPMNNKFFRHQVYIEDLKDTSLLAIPHIIKERGRPVRNTSLQQFEYPITNIRAIQFRRKKGKLKSILIGMGVGTGVGILGGSLVDKNSDLPGLGKVLFGLGGFVSGASIGSLIGNARITIPINGNGKQYDRNKQKIEKYLRDN